MRPTSRLFAAGAALALALTACGGDDDAIVVGGFNFPESTILMEIYAQALEDAGLPVERQPDLGAREVIFPELTAGNIDIMPEYVGSAISVGFGAEPPGSTDAAIESLSTLFGEEGVAVLEPSPAQDRNVFVVTSTFADENAVATLEELAGAGDLTLAGGPECEERATCYAGLVDTYGLSNITFTAIQEKAPRLAALTNDDAQVILLFSTDPVFTDGTLVALEDPREMTPPENVVPVVGQDTLDAHPEVTGILNAVSAALTTEDLAAMNGQAAEGQQPADIAATWLADNGLVG